VHRRQSIPPLPDHVIAAIANNDDIEADDHDNHTQPARGAATAAIGRPIYGPMIRSDRPQSEKGQSFAYITLDHSSKRDAESDDDGTILPVSGGNHRFLCSTTRFAYDSYN
jgi:hypothetical protein